MYSPLMSTSFFLLIWQGSWVFLQSKRAYWKKQQGENACSRSDRTLAWVDFSESLYLKVCDGIASICTYTHMHTNVTYAHTHTHTQTHTHTHTHTHMHTYKHLISICNVFNRTSPRGENAVITFIYTPYTAWPMHFVYQVAAILGVEGRARVNWWTWSQPPQQIHISCLTINKHTNIHTAWFTILLNHDSQ